jgi:hypothetical protein
MSISALISTINIKGRKDESGFSTFRDCLFRFLKILHVLHYLIAMLYTNEIVATNRNTEQTQFKNYQLSPIEVLNKPIYMLACKVPSDKLNFRKRKSP